MLWGQQGYQPTTLVVGKKRKGYGNRFIGFAKRKGENR